MTPFHLVGIDLGKIGDPTAIALIERDNIKEPIYRVRGLYRFPLGTPYTAIPRTLAPRLHTAPLRRHVALAIDATGVGTPVIDQFRKEIPNIPIYAITITAGTTVTGTTKAPHVPKRDLIGTSSVIFEQQRIRIAASMRDTETLRDELLAYRRTTTDHGTDTYSAAAGSHDDLVLALTLALWIGENRRLAPPPPYRSQSEQLRNVRIPGVDELRAPWHNDFNL